MRELLSLYAEVRKIIPSERSEVGVAGPLSSPANPKMRGTRRVVSITSTLPNTTNMDVNDNMMSGHKDQFLPRYLDIKSLPVPAGPLEEATSFQLFDQNYEQAQADNPTRDDQAADPGEWEGDEGGLCPPVGVKYQVKPLTKLVQYSEQNKYWHVRSGRTGNFCISFQLDSKNTIS